MATAPNKIEPVPLRPAIVAEPKPVKTFGSNWLRWGAIAALVLSPAAAGLLWRVHLQNAISYETVPVERGPIQAKVIATGNLNAKLQT